MLSLVLALVAALGTGAAASSPEERRLQATRAKIAEVKSQLAQANADAAVDAEALAEADRQLAAVVDAVGEAERAVERQHLAVEDARQRLVELQADVADQTRLMALRVAAMYKHGSGAPMGAILSSGSAAEAVDRSSYVGVVARWDRRSFEQVDIAQTAVAAQQQELDAQQRVLARVLEEQRAILVEAEEVRGDRAIAAAASRQRADQLAAQESHLEAESRELAALARRTSGAGVSRAQRVAPAVGAGATVTSGGWVFPANGPITSGFGRRWGRMHKGIDIGAPTGTPIYAAASGVVSFSGRMSGYGNIVLIDHGGGIVSAYAHQSRIGVQVGQHVTAGQVIGAVGSTGNSTGPHLHFEVRVQGAARNPRDYV